MNVAPRKNDEEASNKVRAINARSPTFSSLSVTTNYIVYLAGAGPMIWQDHIPGDVKDLYEIYDYRHAAAVIRVEFHREFEELCEALRKFRFSVDDVKLRGGSESVITKKFATLLRPKGWEE